MGSDVPKQFLEVGGLPILMRTIMRFREYGDVNIILVLPKNQQEYWYQLCLKYHFAEDYQIADGGSERFFSIKNALALIPDDTQGVVAVHDGVRPFPSVEVIANCFETARRTGSAVPVIPVVETLRHISPDQISSQGGIEGGYTVPRSEYRLVQTPQAFDIQLHKQAYRQPFNDSFTDDASVVEAYWSEIQARNQNPSPREGQRVGSITLVEGNRENIKITTPFDLIVAEALVSQNRKGAHV